MLCSTNRTGKILTRCSHERWSYVDNVPHTISGIFAFFAELHLFLKFAKFTYHNNLYAYSRCNHLSLMQSMCSCDVCVSKGYLWLFLCDDQECNLIILCFLHPYRCVYPYMVPGRPALSFSLLIDFVSLSVYVGYNLHLGSGVHWRESGNSSTALKHSSKWHW